MAEPGKKIKGVSKSKPKRPNYSEETLRNALNDIREGKESIRSACRKHGIPRSTIQDRLHCRVTDGPRRMGPAPVLGLDGEKKISHYIIEMAKRGFPLNKTVLIKTVESIIKESGQKNPFKDGIPGQKWVKSFLKRHPEISLRVPENITKDRALVTETKIRAWFKNLREYLSEVNASDVLNDGDRILNGDESGFSLCPQTGKVLAPRGYKNIYEVKVSKEKENITVLVIFTASGKICPPLVIFPYVRPPRSIIQSMPKDWVLGRSESGWMRGDIFFEYICNDFNKWLIEKNIKKPVLLLVDGHKSHMTVPLSEFCESNGIILYTLPPRTTHMLQPADVSVFRPLKQGWKNTVREFHSESENPWNSAVTKANFCPLFQKALNTFDMSQQIKNGFRKCGLFPLNEEAVDYTKCLNDNAKPKNRRSSTGITSTEIDIAIKVIGAANLDVKHGIDTNLILMELNDMKANSGRRKSSPKRKSSQKPTPKSTKPDINIHKPDTPQVGSYVTLDDISVIPFELGESILTSNILTESDIALINCSDLGSNVQIINTSQDSEITNASGLSEDILSNWKDLSVLDICSQNIDGEIEAISEGDSQKVISTSIITTAQIHKERTSDNNRPQIKEYDPSLVTNCTIANSDDQIQPADNSENYCFNSHLININNGTSGKDTIKSLIQENRQPLEAIQLNDPFVKHLSYPKSSTSKNQRASVQLPSAISSQAWRKHYEVKEKEKKEKEEAITKRKILRKEAKENKEKEKMEKRKWNIEKNNNCQKQNNDQNTESKGIKKHKTKLSSRKKNLDFDDPDDYCAICKKSYFNKEGPNVEWIQCVRCQKWLHVTCSTNPDICPICLGD